jgi:hypothetical protein
MTGVLNFQVRAIANVIYVKETELKSLVGLLSNEKELRQSFIITLPEARSWIALLFGLL